MQEFDFEAYLKVVEEDKNVKEFSDKLIAKINKTPLFQLNIESRIQFLKLLSYNKKYKELLKTLCNYKNIVLFEPHLDSLLHFDKKETFRSIITTFSDIEIDFEKKEKQALYERIITIIEKHFEVSERKPLVEFILKRTLYRPFSKSFGGLLSSKFENAS